MKCKRLVSILLACMMLASGAALAGCSSGGTVVGRVNGEAITEKDVNLFADYILMQNAMTRAEIADAEEMKILNENALETAVMFKLIVNRGKELKLYPLSGANQKEVDEIVTQNADYLPEGMTKEELRGLETKVKVLQLVTDEINKSVSVTDEELKAEYDAQVEFQKADYTADPAMYEQAKTDGATVIVYKPEGYRYVKHILIAFPEDVTGQILEAQYNGDAETVKKLRDEALPQIQARADEALSKVQAGSDFDALMAEYGEDPGMQAEPESKTGYELGAATDFVDEFKQAALALASVGDTTGLVASDFGYHIIKWVGNVPSGAVAYDDVREDLQASLLETKQGDAWNAEYEKWEAAAKIEKYPEKIPVKMVSPAPTIGEEATSESDTTSEG